ncbi:SMI1/KNR4 family protein [Aquimarina rubra]|uniref:SMI1/KNR4 family protein n=1 Tax=Aquimarina rubra TaxID=1920033 RepID=A0ABW5L9N1_9FLAO
MKEKVLSILIDLMEQRITTIEFRDVFFSEYLSFEAVLIGESEDKFNSDIFYRLIELNFDSQASEVLSLVKKYLNYNKIEILLTDEKIKSVEEKLGYSLPESYKDFIKNYNKNYFEDYSVIPINETIPDNLKYYLGEGFWTINSIYRISLDENDTKSILYGKSLAVEWGLPNDIIPLEGDGHTWLAFDYRDCIIEPTIIFIESDALLSFKLAENFTELLNILLPYDSVYNENGDIIYNR